MVTIYYETQTFRVRFPVLHLGRWSGAFLVRLQDRCEDCLDEVARLRELAQVNRRVRAYRFAAASRRVERERELATALFMSRGA